MLCVPLSTSSSKIPAFWLLLIRAERQCFRRVRESLSNPSLVHEWILHLAFKMGFLGNLTHKKSLWVCITFIFVTISHDRPQRARYLFSVIARWTVFSPQSPTTNGRVCVHSYKHTFMCMCISVPQKNDGRKFRRVLIN